MPPVDPRAFAIVPVTLGTDPWLAQVYALAYEQARRANEAQKRGGVLNLECWN